MMGDENQPPGTSYASLCSGIGGLDRAVESVFGCHLTWHSEYADGDDLVTTLARLLPTPTSRDWKGQNQRGDTTCLPGAMKLLSVGDPSSLPSDDGKLLPDQPPDRSTPRDGSTRI